MASACKLDETYASLPLAHCPPATPSWTSDVVWSSVPGGCTGNEVCRLQQLHLILPYFSLKHAVNVTTTITITRG